MGYVKRTALAAAVLTAVAAAPAQAGEVIEVNGQHAQRVFDPAVPTWAQIALSPPVVARAGAARAGAAGIVAHSSTTRGRRAVYSTLRRELRRKHIKRSQYRRWRTTYVRSIRTLRHLGGARGAQLRYVLTSVESLALRRRLIASRPLLVSPARIDLRHQDRAKRKFADLGFSRQTAQITAGGIDRGATLQDARNDDGCGHLAHDRLRLLPGAGADPER